MQFNIPQNKLAIQMERVEQYILNPLRCYKCQKYGHYKDKLLRRCSVRENVVNKILTTTLMTVNFHVNVQIVAVIIRCTRDLVRVGGKRRKY